MLPPVEFRRPGASHLPATPLMNFRLLIVMATPPYPGRWRIFLAGSRSWPAVLFAEPRQHRRAGCADHQPGGARSKRLDAPERCPAVFGNASLKNTGWRQILQRCQGMEWSGKADPLFRAAEAGMADTDGPGAGAGLAEQNGGAIGIGFRSLAAELVQATPFSVHLIPELLRESAGIEMGPPLAVFVDQPAIGKFGPPLLVKFGKFFEGEEMQNG